jgi:hypothetical protein
MQTEENPLELAARRAVELGSELANQDMEAGIWGVANGLLAGAACRGGLTTSKQPPGHWTRGACLHGSSPQFPFP